MKRKLLSFLFIGSSALIFASVNPTMPVSIVPTSEVDAQTWMYTTIDPAADWNLMEFDEAGWSEGLAGFGTLNAEFTHANTEWLGAGWIYLRKKFTAGALTPETIAAMTLRLWNDNWVEVYINGGLAYQTTAGWEVKYVDKPILEDAANSFIPNGENVIAVKCYQDGGGQYIDCGLNVPMPAIEVLPSSDVTTPETLEEWFFTEIAPDSLTWKNNDYEITGDWNVGAAGFGGSRFATDRGTSVTNTLWSDSENTDIWLKKVVTFPTMTAEQLSNLKLKIFYDDDVQVFINGDTAFTASGYVQKYVYKDITAKAKSSIVLGGENTISVKCHQNTGGQYIDLGIYTLVSGSTAVKNAKNSNVDVYAAAGVLNVTGKDISKIDIYNVYGKLVKSVKANGNANAINISSLASGVYMASVVTNGQKSVVKFIK